MTTSAKNTLAVSSLYQALNVLAAETSLDASLRQVLALLRIAMSGDDGIAQSQLVTDLKGSGAAIVRTIQKLSTEDYLRDKKTNLPLPGFGLVEGVPDAQNRNFRIIRLLPKGERVIAKVAEKLKG